MLYSRRIRSRYTSRCNSPIPEMTVSLVSGSVRTRKVGSSFVKRCKALDRFCSELELAVEGRERGTKVVADDVGVEGVVLVERRCGLSVATWCFVTCVLLA